MAHIRSVLIYLAITGASMASAVGIESGFSRFYEAAQIRTVGNYFGAAFERQGFRTVIPSRSDNTAGHYFILKLTDRSSSAAPALARITYIASDSKEERTAQWQLSSMPKPWLYLGLTGADWADPKLQPVAWKIELLDSGGAVLASHASTLWSID